MYIKLKDPKKSISNAAGFSISGEEIKEFTGNVDLSSDKFVLYATFEDALNDKPMEKDAGIGDTSREDTELELPPWTDDYLDQNAVTVKSSLREDRDGLTEKNLKDLLSAEKSDKDRVTVKRQIKKMLG